MSWVLYNSEACSKTRPVWRQFGASQPTNFLKVWPSSKADRCAGHILPIHPEEILLPELCGGAAVPPARDGRSRKLPSIPPSFPRVPYRLLQAARTRARCACRLPSGLPSPSPAPPAADLSAHRQALSSLRCEFLLRCVPNDVRRALFAVLQIIYFVRNQIATEQPLRLRCNRCKIFFQIFAIAGNAHHSHFRPLP